MILLVSEIELSRLEILIIYHLIFCNYTYFGCFFTIFPVFACEVVTSQLS